MNTFPFKIAIFDLDLTLWDGNKLYPATLQILELFKKHNIKQYISSFNLQARNYCEHLKIDHYFEDIYYGRKFKKSQMVNEILRKNKTVDNRHIVFFDDNFDNIIDVFLTHNLKTIHIDPRKGITWKDVSGLTSY